MKRLGQRAIPFFLLAALGCGNTADPKAVTPELLAPDQRLIEEALSNGTFVVTSQRASNKCLDVAGGTNQNGTAVQIADCNGSDAQKWQLVGSQLRIFGNKCLNVKDGRDSNGSRLQIWTCDDNDGNAKWSINTAGNVVQWQGHNRCVDLTAGNTQAGTPIQIWDCDGNNGNQKWKFAGTQGGQVGGSGTQSPVSVSGSSMGTAPQGLDVAPYFWTWGRWGNYAIKSLIDARAKADMRSATIAFGLSGGGCNISGDLTDMGDDIRSYIQGGGRVILSFGGAAGTYVERTCSDSQALANAFDGQMKTLNTRALDFDIEGQNLDTMQYTNVLLDALKILQGRYQDVYVSFTLPVDDNSGLPERALNVVRGARSKGVKVSRVNIMTMDYGHGPKSGQDMGDQVVNSAQVTFNQLKSVYGDQADSAIWRMIGITPMIGENDDHFKFTTAHAQKVANFVRQKGIGMLSFWGMQRDRSGSGSLNDFSNVAQSDFEFLRIFNAAK